MAGESDIGSTVAQPDMERVEAVQDAASMAIAPAVEGDSEERAAKRLKMDPAAEPADSKIDDKAIPETGVPDDGEGAKETNANGSGDRRAGMAPVKKEFLIDVSTLRNNASSDVMDDDEAEGRGNGDNATRRDDRDRDDRDAGGRGKGRKDRKDKKKKGQNTERTFGKFEDAAPLCNSRALYPEFSPRECKFGDRCKLSHDIRKYLQDGRRGDIETLGGVCPIFEKFGSCPSGWKCRFLNSHMAEVERQDGRKELVLVDKTAEKPADEDGAKGGSVDAGGAAEGNGAKQDDHAERRAGIVNIVSMSDKMDLSRKRIDYAKADEYIKWMNGESDINQEFFHRRKDQSAEGIDDLRARYVDPPFKPSEKRRLYFGPETPTLAPLTTQGNLPFRRLCVELGCQLTYSEMAMGMPLLQGSKADWTLMKAHESEISPPKFAPVGKTFVFDDYDNSKDIKFGAQISGNQPWLVTKAADILNRLCPHLRLIDLNCGCPIDMVFKSGGGSGLLDAPSKLERMIRGMNATSGEIPITAKIRTGVKNNRPVAAQLIGRLAFGGREHRARLGAPGCAAVTLHGRSREQRYTKRADWGYIGECAALIKQYNEQKSALTDTVAEPDESTLPNAKDGRMYFLGNGDCYSHHDYFENVEKARVDSVMIGRGALIKPWIFEEIEKGQYLDKSSSERLTYIEKFVRYGLEAWGTDELGIGFTRRFLLEWMSFTHRYVPIGLLEHLPPNLNDRPPAYKGRDEMETLMASTNYKDWIKISEMFLGPVHPTFQFIPKHKSNAYEAEG
ncbi:hypothetical protein DCS_06108 [Drechmeria coniospora]|uniref:tRNA-dihydrouridine(47) synthase [NAD(P)(+)] n=1 Tax=Drechmeria coniospora TaxID=98403 RepID=A0A151GAP7_DRECN|nr:hypothetical protein DCS_06108 [Drechmeria coniospora]KYK54151.1 hypothetical protein DCS_06108 [Drechmeria coniospora]